MPAAAAVVLLDVLRSIATHAATVDADIGLRHSLLLAEAADKVPADRCLPDPPLLRLEAEASQAYLSTLLHISAAAPEATRDACTVEARLVQLCMRNLERFEGQEMAAESGEGAGPSEYCCWGNGKGACYTLLVGSKMQPRSCAHGADIGMAGELWGLASYSHCSM